MTGFDASRLLPARAGKLLGAVVALGLVAACASAPAGSDPPTGGRHPRPTGAPRSVEVEQAPVVLDGLTVDEAVRIALSANPRLAASLEEVGAAAGRVRQAGLWPNPSLEVGTEEGPSNRALGFGGDNKIGAAISQPIPLSGRIGAQRTVAKLEVEVIRLLHDQERRSLASAVQGAFYAALARENALEIATASRDIARDLYEGAATRVEEGAAPETERIRAEIELAESEAALAEARAAVKITRQDLLTLLGDRAVQVSSLGGSLQEAFPPIGLERLRTAALDGHPALLAARKDVERARAELVLAQRSWFADPEVGFGAGRLREDGEDQAILEWGVTIPLPLFDRNQGAVAERRALVRRSEQVLRATLGEIENRLNTVLAGYERLRAQASSYRRRIIPGAESAIDLVREGFRQGKLTQLDVLDAQRTLAASRQSYIGILEGLHRSAAEIEELGGRRISELQQF